MGAVARGGLKGLIMIPEMETPPAGGTANGANIKDGELSMQTITYHHFPATAHHLRSVLIARRFGLADHLAANVADLVFAGGAA
ncbi:hypothetical protein [Haematobacter genomosp. 1]|uniref:Uncharacterized protein n=1 Tax=Haematobacter genomosp. 1 TaxID=366618 RepID=A0A212A6C8_9RHOB|nr:hypothetical protein [Haematobacter genomosp. 1]OWJ74617.1 hypothetical protein CDV49_19065 [Haematobacter genomosp. 1]